MDDVLEEGCNCSIDYQQPELKVLWEQLQSKLNENEIKLRESMAQYSLETLMDKRKSSNFIQLIDEIDKLRRIRTNLIVDEISLKAKMERMPIYRKPSVFLPKDDFLAKSDDFNRRFQKFIYDYQDVCKKFAMIRFYDESRDFLHRHQYIVCIEASYFLQLWGIVQLMEKKKTLANVVVHQAACMEYILELGRLENVHPRYCINLFFDMIQRCTPRFKAAFLGDITFLLKCFKSNARYNAVRNRDALAETARKSRLCPNGIDPFDVLNKLPQNLRVAFQRQDIHLLRQSLSSLDPEVALKYIKNCINVGIWVPYKLKENIKDDEFKTNDIRHTLSIFFDKKEELDSSEEEEEDEYYSEGYHTKEEDTIYESSLTSTNSHNNFDEVKMEKPMESNFNFPANLKISETNKYHFNKTSVQYKPVSNEHQEIVNKILINVIFSDVFFENLAKTEVSSNNTHIIEIELK